MYRQHGFQDKDLLLETLVKDDTMTFFPEFNLLVVSSSYDPSEGLYNRTTAIFNARTSEIASGEFFKGCDYVSDMVFERGQDKAFAVIDSFDRDADGSCWIDPPPHVHAGRSILLESDHRCRQHFRFGRFRLVLSKTPDVRSGGFRAVA